jgi:hypothetical protein
MVTNDADDLVPFQDVRVIRSTAPSLLCLIRGRSVWLPRGHISGKLWCTGDRGKLFIRRWVAQDRNLLDLHGAALGPPPPLFSRPLPAGPLLHLVRSERSAHHAK